MLASHSLHRLAHRPTPEAEVADEHVARLEEQQGVRQVLQAPKKIHEYMKKTKLEYTRQNE